MDDILIADDLLLLLLDDESGKINRGSYADIGTVIGGALLVELSLRGAVELTDKQAFRQPKVVSSTDSSSLPPVLAAALADVAEKERTATALVSRLGKGRKQELLDRLVDKGMVRCEHDKVLGLFPRTRWPAEDSHHETEVRRRISQALIEEHTDDERTAALISLLSALDVVSAVISIDGVSRRDVKKRAKAISEGDWANKAVRDAITEIQTAVIASIVVSAVVVSS